MPNFACRRSAVVCLLLMTIVSFCMGQGQSLPSVHAAAAPAASPKVTSASKLVASPASAAVGALVTLTATVQSSAGQPLTVGSVAFYNGTALLGSSQVIGRTSGGGVVGTAVWRTRSLPVGTDSLTAVYSGPDGASTSAAVKVAITGAYPGALARGAGAMAGDEAAPTEAG